MFSLRRLMALVLTTVMIMVPVYSEPSIGRYIVLMQDNAHLEAAQAVLASKGMLPERLGGINGFSVTGNLNVLRGLEKQLAIRHIEPDQIVKALVKPVKPTVPQPPEAIQWGVDHMNAPEVWGAYDGDGIKVAVIDTGIDTSHPDLKVFGGVNYVRTVKTYNDDNGHGTHVAGIIAALDNEIGVVGMAPLARLYAVKVLNSQGSGYLSDVIRGINWAASNGMTVINLSLGADSGSLALQESLDLVAEKGVIAVAAAGNDASDIDYPGAYSSTIAVGAVDVEHDLAYFSSFGPELDVVAPGLSVYSTYKGGIYKTLSGTSMATPHVAGLAVLFKDKYPGGNLDDFRTFLMDTSDDMLESGYDIYTGYGFPNALKLVQ